MTRSSPPPPAHAALPSPCPDATRRPDTVRDKFVGEFVGHLGAAIHPGGGGGGGRGGPGEKCFMNSSLSNSSVPAGGGGAQAGGSSGCKSWRGGWAGMWVVVRRGGKGIWRCLIGFRKCVPSSRKGLPSPSLVFPGVCVCVCVLCVCVHTSTSSPLYFPPSWSEGCSALRYTHAHIHLHTHTHTHIPRTLATPRPLLVFLVYLCVCVYVCMYVCTYVCMHASMYLCIYMNHICDML
jgi:hypothetical protein